MAHDGDTSSDFDFSLVNSFGGYVSSIDPTNAVPNIMVQGSQNVYKKVSGTLAVRPGQQRIGAINNTYSPVSSEYVWYNSSGETLPVWVTNNTLQVMYNNAWYTLQGGLTTTRYVFDKVYNAIEAKDYLIFTNTTSNLQYWSGGIAIVASATAPVAGVIQALSSGPTVGGTGYKVGDVVNIGTGTGGTATVTTISGGGTFGPVTGVTLALPGTGGYSVATGVATTGGSGTGLTVNITGVFAAGTITKTVPGTSWQQASFSTDPAVPGNKQILINGTTYTYTGGEGTATLEGVTPDPSGIAANTVALQAVITEVPSFPIAISELDFLKVINNQVYVGSYTARTIFISSSTGFLNYTVPTPRLPGSPGYVILDANAKGIGYRQGQAHVAYGTSSWCIITFVQSTVSIGTGGSTSSLTIENIVPVVKPVARLQAAYAHEFIDNVGDNIVYLGQDQQLRSFGDFNNAFVPAYPSYSQDLQTELMAVNFAGGGLRCIGEFTYVTAPVTGTVYLYQVRQLVDSQGNVTAERLWHSPFIWNCTRVDEINGNVVGFSNANPQLYQLWNTNQWYDDSPSGQQLPYSCVCALSYRDGGRKQGLQQFDKLYTEGYLSEGTPLSVRVNYNYQGSLNVLLGVVNSIALPVTLFEGQTAPSLGDSTPGDDALGNGLFSNLNGMNALPKFKCVNYFNLQNCFEYQPIYYSNDANAQWEILALGTNASIDANQQATYLINKLRK